MCQRVFIHIFSYSLFSMSWPDENCGNLALILDSNLYRIFMEKRPEVSNAEPYRPKLKR